MIDEAVELVKAYSTDESGRFVNGILSTIAADIGTAVRPEPGPCVPLGRARVVA